MERRSETKTSLPAWGHRAGVAIGMAAAVACVVTLQVVFLKAPVERSMGLAQKIFYFHVPAAYAMYLGALFCLVGSIGTLLRGSPRWDALARAGAELAATMGLVVMTTGPLWASRAWGRAWTWDPRLTTALLSLLIYLAYLVLRAFLRGGEAEGRFAAAVGVLGAANLPLIHWSVRQWGGQHPQVITGSGGGLQHPDMRLALGLGFATFTLLGVALVTVRMRLHWAGVRLEALEREAAERGLAEE